MSEAALPGGEGQKKGVFEGLPALTGPPEKLEEEVGSKAHTGDLLPAAFSLNPSGHSGYRVNNRKGRSRPADQRVS